MNPPPFHLLTPVWGDRFTQRYIEFFLPAQLADLRSCSGDLYKIVTTRRDAEAIRSSAAFRQLSSLLQTEFVYFRDEELAIGSYPLMTRGYERCLQAPLGTSFVFLTPDSIWSPGCFRRLRELVVDGYRAVLIGGIRVKRETFVPEFLRSQRDARTLSTLAVKHVQKITESFMFDMDFHNRDPAALYWRVGDGLLAYHFVCHPLLIRPRIAIDRITDTIDYRVVPRTVHLSEVYVVQDSEDLLGVDVADADYDQKSIDPGPLTREHVIKWLDSGWPTAFHRWVGLFPIVTNIQDSVALAKAKRAAEDLILGMYRELRDGARLEVRNVLRCQFWIRISLATYLTRMRWSAFNNLRWSAFYGRMGGLLQIVRYRLRIRTRLRQALSRVRRLRI